MEMPLSDDDPEDPSLRPVTSKSVLIAEPGDISPIASPPRDADVGDASFASISPKQYRTNSSRRLSGRPAPNLESTPSLHSISSISSHGSIKESTLVEEENKHSKSHHHVRRPGNASHIISQVAEWLQQEKAKQAARKPAMHRGHAKLAHASELTKAFAHSLQNDEPRQHTSRQRRSSSDLSTGGLALEKLEQILSKSIKLGGESSITPTEDKLGSYFPRSKSTRKTSKQVLRKRSTGTMSGSDSADDELLVPSAEVTLDNSKTLRYTGGAPTSDVDHRNPSKRAAKEKAAWRQFKSEVVRLTHTLKIPGWRRVAVEQSGEVDVERLSGALTNAVYVVSPPKDLPQTPGVLQDGRASVGPKKKPHTLLLRVYGPHVGHLIDREGELQILRRLSRKQIGPRLLGTFTNGRFEQYFHARTLTARDLRIPETSKQIAKRMRELHDGVELLEEERKAGAFIWRNWDKWVEKCEEIVNRLDVEVLANKQASGRSRTEEWKKRGLVCGVQWCAFRQAVDKYRKWLYDQYGGSTGIREQLVFAHNDTQYGNLLRLEPSGESPLLLPANEHKRLVVIDFEYASANVPGLEFANHFTEWCYDYHENVKPYALREQWYPTVEEQRRFIKAYVQHNPTVIPSATPRQSSSQGPTSSISAFVLDSRAPPTQYAEDEFCREKASESEIERLRHETRIWRLANSAQWVAWGIVQAKVPGMKEAIEAQKAGVSNPQASLNSNRTSPKVAGLAKDACDNRPENSEAAGQAPKKEEEEEREEEEEEEEEEEFDYLGYAQERAMFFWGDMLQFGLVKREELSKELLEKVKIVEY